MKKVVIGMIVFVAGFITVYTIFFWEPKLTSDMVNLGGVVDSYSEEEINVMEEEKSKEVMSEVKPILKVDIEAISNDISNEDYSTLKKIITTLSTSDIGMIEEALNNEDKESGIREAIDILKTRLSSRDYEKIEEILSPYINFNNFKEKL